MAIGTITVAASVGQKPTGATFVGLLSFAGDGAYAAGGTPAFQASVRTALGLGNIEVLAVLGQDCGGYVPVYDKTNDKLKVYEQTDTATTPLIETATSDLSGTTFNVLIIGK
jgi:hypothetical protein